MPSAFILSFIELKRRIIHNENIRKRGLRDASDPLSITDSAFTGFYRVNKTAFVMILEKISRQMGNSSIPEVIQLAATIRFLAFGAYQGVVANDLNISIGRSTMSKVMWKVINLMEGILCPTWITLKMNESETTASKLHFFQKFGIPNVIGCVDGTHVRILRPSSDESLFYNRKGYFIINTMIVCDYKMQIIAVDARRPGSCHDAFIWRMSEAKKYYLRKYENGEDAIVLGDSGYGLEPYLMTPYRNPEYGTNEHLFNQKHCAGRNIIERTIGNLKIRFRCLLSTTLHYTPQKVGKIINVCCALHNICKKYNIPIEDIVIADPYQGEDVEEDNDCPENEFEENLAIAADAVTIRNNIANSLR